MRVRDERARVRDQAAWVARPEPPPRAPLAAAQILGLQRGAGNAAVNRLLREPGSKLAARSAALPSSPMIARVATTPDSLGETGTLGQMKAVLGLSTYVKIREELARYHGSPLENRVHHLTTLLQLIADWKAENASSTTPGNLARRAKLDRLDDEIRAELGQTTPAASAAPDAAPQTRSVEEAEPTPATTPAASTASPADTGATAPEPAAQAPAPAPGASAAAASASGGGGDVLCLGHGTLEFDQGAHPEVMDGILIPPGTTLKFYTREHNLTLAIRGNDYTEFNDRWRELRPDWAPLQPKHATYNYTLTPETRAGSRELAMNLDWGGATVVSLEPGTVRYLCEGTPETCPTPALVAAEKAGHEIAPERWKHHCTGLLGEFQGHDLHWMVCTQFVGAELDTEMADYLRRGGGITPVTATGASLLNPEEKVARFREFAARFSKLSVTARGTTSEIGSANAFVKDVADLLSWPGKHLHAIVRDSTLLPLATAGTSLSRAAVTDDEAAAKVVQLAQRVGQSSSAELAAAAPDDATYGRDVTRATKAFEKLAAETLLPVADELCKTVIA